MVSYRNFSNPSNISRSVFKVHLCTVHASQQKQPLFPCKE